MVLTHSMKLHGFVAVYIDDTLCTLTTHCVHWRRTVYINNALCTLTTHCVHWRRTVYIDDSLCTLTTHCIHWRRTVYIDGAVTQDNFFLQLATEIYMKNILQVPVELGVRLGGCLWGGESVPGCPSYSACWVEKTLFIWNRVTRQAWNMCFEMDKLCKLIPPAKLPNCVNRSEWKFGGRGLGDDVSVDDVIKLF